MIKINLKTLALAVGMAVAGTTSAEMTTETQSTGHQIRPLEAFTVHAQDYSAVVYYTVLENGSYEVVTTIAPVDESEIIGSQHRATMEIGQTYSLSLQLDKGVSSEAHAAGIKFVADAKALYVTEL